MNSRSPGFRTILRRGLVRVLAATSSAAIALAASGCGGDEPVSPPPATAAAATTANAEPTGLPEVASAAPQPDTIAATLGDTVTVTGKDLFGKKSATIEVTLAKPRLVDEVKYPKTGAVQRPKRGVYVVFDIVIEGVDGTYQFNPLHFHLIPRSDVPGWRSEANFGLGDRPDAPTQIDALNSIRSGSISAGDRISGSLVFDQPRAAVNNAALVLRALLLTDGPAAASWPLS